MPTVERKAKRRPVEISAWILLSGDRSAPVIIEDISTVGARLATGIAKALPDQLTLNLTIDGRVKRHCRVAWRSESAVGVEFVRYRELLTGPGELSPA